MSAFICSPEHVATIAAYHATCEEEAKRLGSELMINNIASVAYRYPRDTEGNRPGPVGYATDKALVDAVVDLLDSKRPGVYEFWASAKAKTPIEIIKLAQSLDYQSCEPPSWNGSRGEAMINEIIAHACRELPGYNQASWSI